MKPHIFIGVDNGLKGGLCAVGASGNLLGYSRMPVLKRAGKEEIDIVKVRSWCYTYGDSFVFAPEETPKHAETAQSMRSMALSYGKLLALAELSQWDLRPVEVKEWHKEMLGKKIPKGKTKEFALAAALALEPQETWVPPMCRVAHDGVVDAYLIARFAAFRK